MTPPSKVKLTGGVFQDSEGNALAYGYLEMLLNQDASITGVGQVASGIAIKILLDQNGSIEGTSGLTFASVATSVGTSAVYTGTVTGGANNAWVGLTFVVTGFSTGANNGTFVCTASTATTLTLANASASSETHAATATASQAIWGTNQMSPVNAYYRVLGFTAQGQPAWGPNNQQVTGNGGTFDVGTWVPNTVVSWTPTLQPLDLETNAAVNPDQFRLNFKDTASVQWAVDSSGNLTATSAAAVALQTNETPNGSQSLLDLHAGSGINLVDNGSGRVTISGVAGTGSLAIVATQNTGGSGSTPINLSTEGTRDFMAFAIGSALVDAQSQSSSGLHGKRQGGWIRRNCRPFGPGGTIASATTTSTPWTWTTTIGDDDTIQGTNGNNILSAVNFACGYFGNAGGSAMAGGFGFEVWDMSSTSSRTLNLYVGFNSGGVRTDTTFTIVARLADGSAVDQTLVVTPGATGVQWYKVVITHTAGSGAVPLFVTVTAQQQGADSGTQIFFGAASAA